MDDLEIVRLCAEAMGLLHQVSSNGNFVALMNSTSHTLNGLYEPLRSDAQAMALVKKFNLNIDSCFYERGPTYAEPNSWQASTQSGSPHFFGINVDLNRAICLCVANMQKAKHD